MNFGSALLWNEKTYVNYSTTLLVVNTIFSRVHATLQSTPRFVRLSVSWLVGRSHLLFYSFYSYQLIFCQLGHF